MIALPDADLQKAQMKLTVANTGTSHIVLDKTLAAGFSLRFKTDLSEEFTRSDEKDVTTKEPKKLEVDAWYGQTADKTGMWSGRARSNTLVIEKR